MRSPWRSPFPRKRPMTELQTAVVLMAVMGIAFAWSVKLLFDAFIVHLRQQSELTSRAIAQAGEAIALNGKILAAFQASLSQEGSDGAK